MRYIGLEIHELIQEIMDANNDGIKTKGSLPISMQVMERTNNRTLALILEGNIDAADSPLSANIKMTQAFKKQLKGLLCTNPPDQCNRFDDWNERADAIINDLMTAIANDQTSAPQVLVTNTITEVSPATFTTETTDIKGKK